MFCVLRFLLIFAVLLLALPAFAMTLTVEQRSSPRAGMGPGRPIYVIRMTGMIERGDADTLRKALERLESVGYEFVAGLEVEFHVFRIKDPRLQPEDAGQPGTPPDVELLTTGYQLLTEHKYDQLEPLV